MIVLKLNTEQSNAVKGIYGITQIIPIPVNDFYILPIECLNIEEINPIIKDCEQIDYIPETPEVVGKYEGELPDYNGIKRNYVITNFPTFDLQNEQIQINLFVKHDNNSELDKEIYLNVNNNVVIQGQGAFDLLYDLSTQISFSRVIQMGVNISVQDGTIDRRLYI